MQSPEAIVSRYFECLRDESYGEAVTLVAPVCLRRFVEHEAPMYRPHPAPTVEECLERDPEMPRKVAEYRVSQSASRPRPSLSDYFSGVETEEELECLDDGELYARHLEAVDPAARCRRQIDQLIDRYPEYEDQLLTFRSRQGLTWEYVVLGSVEVGGRVMVLFEHPRVDEAEKMRWEPKPSVAVLRRTAEGWRLAGDPNPYSGMGVAVTPIPVVDAEGNKIWLDLNEPA